MNRSCLAPTWTKPRLGKHSSVGYFFGRVFRFFVLQSQPVVGWTVVMQHVALISTVPPNRLSHISKRGYALGSTLVGGLRFAVTQSARRQFRSYPIDHPCIGPCLNCRLIATSITKHL